jgi:hypothetical protein
MTRFAKPLLLETPCCQEKVMRQRFASVNSFGLSSRWSDGYTWMPMVSEASRLAYCPGCNKTYWLEDATELGVVPSFNEKSVRKKRWLPRIFWKSPSEGYLDVEAQVESSDLDYVGYHKHPRPADLLLAVLREEWSSPERELYLRTRLWWIGNHKQRGRKTASPMTQQQAEDNKLSLLALHRAAGAADNVAVTMGELLRQLGRFDEAVAVLEKVARESDAAAVILGLVKQGKTEVCALEQF